MPEPDPQPEQLPLNPASADPPPPEPDPAVVLAQEREARARAEGEAAALRAQLAARPAAPPAPAEAPLTPALVQGAFERGEITEVQRIQALADLQAQARIAASEQARRLEEARNRASQGIAEYVAAFPDLAKAGSALLGRVAAELQEMARDEGADPSDLRTQLRAVKSVCGAIHRKDARDFQRERIPVGGSPFAAGGGESPGGSPPNKLAHVPPAQLAHWKRLGYTQAEMEAEAPFVKVRS
jgi:hypothetical protein